ncbi:polyamine aminopropyltransferase [Candidatus Riflebacteria bacterium]
MSDAIVSTPSGSEEQNTKEIFPILCSVFLLSSSLLIFELSGATLSTYLQEDSSLNFSLTIGLFLSATGLGCHLGRWIENNELQKFIQFQLFYGIIGGLGAPYAHLVYLYTDDFYIFYCFWVLILGTALGITLPLALKICRIRLQTSAEDKNFSQQLVSRILTFDYLGALFATLLFPLLLLPYLGLLKTSFFMAIIIILGAFFNINHFQEEIEDSHNLNFICIVALFAYTIAFLCSQGIDGFFLDRVYGGTVLHHLQTPYQNVVITKRKDDLRLYINGNIQLSTRDEYRYHETLVHPVLSNIPIRNQILVLGGGDGMAVREILKYQDVKRIILVDIDPQLVELCKNNPILRKINGNSLRDAKIKFIHMDAFVYVKECRDIFNGIIVDFPDPNNESLAKLYTLEFFKTLKRILSPDGLISIQSTSPYYAPRSFWCIGKTLEKADFETLPYHCYIPSFGDWGFFLAGLFERKADMLKLQTGLPLKFLNQGQFQALFFFPVDLKNKYELEENSFYTLSLLKYYLSDWELWD